MHHTPVKLLLYVVCSNRPPSLPATPSLLPCVLFLFSALSLLCCNVPTIDVDFCHNTHPHTIIIIIASQLEETLRALLHKYEEEKAVQNNKLSRMATLFHELQGDVSAPPHGATPFQNNNSSSSAKGRGSGEGR